MTENTPAGTEAGSAQGAATNPPEPQPATPATPNQPAETPAVDELPTLVKRLQEEKEALSKRMRDKDRFIGQLQSEQAETRRMVEEMQRRGQPNGQPPADPIDAEFQKSFDDLDPRRFSSALEQKVAASVQQALQKSLPAAMHATQVQRETQDGFGRLRGMGVDQPPEELRLDQTAATLKPEEAYVAKIMREQGPEAAHQFLGQIARQRETERKRAEITDSLASGKPLGPDIIKSFAEAFQTQGVPPGQMGYTEGEYPNLMYELSKAPDSRVVPDDKWANDQGW